MSLNRTLLATAVAFVIHAAQAQGDHPQQTPATDTKTLSAIKVEDNDEDPGRTEDSSSYTTQSTSTAFKLPLTLRETPQTVTVIPQQVIDDFNLKDTKDILFFTPGVHVQNERNTQAYFFKARGFDMQTQWDGIPSPSGFGGRGQNTPDSAFIDHVEVLHGAAGLIAGPGAPGGTVNLAHKTPGQEFSSEFEAGLDSFGGYRLVADVGGPMTDGGVGGRLVAVHEQINLYIDDAEGKHNAFYGVLEVPAGDNTRFLVGASYEEGYDANFAQHFGIPSRPDGSLYDIPRDQNLGAAWAHEDTQLLGTFVRGEHSFANGWSVKGMLSYETTDHDALEGVPNSEVTPEMTVWAQYEGWANQSTALDIFADGPLELFGRTHQIMFGFNGSKRREAQDDYQFGLEPVGVIDTDNPSSWDPNDALHPDDVEFGSMNWGNADKKQYGVFAAGRFEIRENLHTILGSRISWTDVLYTDTDKVKESGKVTPYAGLVWDFAKSWSAYASYSDIFQLQDSWTRDYQGNFLAPIVGKNYEVGLKLELLDGAFNGALAVYRLDQTGLAEPDYENENPGICGGLLDPCYKATGLVRSQGVELSLSGEIAEGWQIIGGIGYIDQEHKTGDSAGLRYDTLTPKTMVHLAASYRAPDDRWGLGAGVRYQSEVFSSGTMDWDFDLDEEWETIPFRIQQDSYVVYSLFGRYKFNDTVSAHLSLENIGDEAYLSGISWPAHGQVWGEPRRATLTVVGRF